MITKLMGYTRLPGPLSEPPSIEPASPSAPVTGLDQPGPVGLKAGPDACSGTPRLVGWPRMIEWNEFEIIPARPAGIHEDAQIDAGVALGDKKEFCFVSGKGRLGIFTIEITVDKKQSWVVRGFDTDELLSHEQGHYDLQGLFARVLMDRLSRLWASDNEELGRLVDVEFKAAQKDAQAMSNRYDDETRHGLDVQKQSQWKAAIQKAITTGDPFQAP